MQGLAAHPESGEGKQSAPAPSPCMVQRAEEVRVPSPSESARGSPPARQSESVVPPPTHLPC